MTPPPPDAPAGRSLTRLAFAQLRRNRFAMASFWVLVLFYLAAAFADVLAPYHYDNEARGNSYNPPTPLRFRDADGVRHWRPFVYPMSFTRDENFRRVYVEDTSRPVPLHFWVKGDAHKLLGLIATERHLFGLADPAVRIYLCGADARGRDLLSRMLYGARVSLSIGFAGVFISLVLGMLVGGIAGYFGGRVDDGLMRLCEMIMMLPGFYLLLILRTTFPPEMGSVQTYFLIVVILSFIGWAGTARVIRGMVLAVAAGPMVQAAQAGGLHWLRIVRRHALPTTYSYLIVSVTLSVPGYMLGESALSLLGLGIQDPYASWGNLLQDAMSIADIRLHPWVLAPGILIFIVTMAFNFLGDGLRDALDPHMVVRAPV